jgi:TonB family protein
LQLFHQEIIFDHMKPFLLLIIVSLAIGNISSIAQTKDTTYFNGSWRDTTAANASYYRVRTRQATGWLVTDYLLNGKTQMTGIFSDDSSKVRQGEFTWFDSTGMAIHKCSYTKNKKDGRELYTWSNKKMMMTGVNKDDQMEGEWLGYYRSGQIAGDVVYAKGQQISGTFYNEDGSKNKKVKDFIRESEYPGGAAQWLRFLNKTFRYPDEAIKQKIQGTVVVQFIVDEEGNPMDIKVIRPVNSLLDAEAIRVISQSRDWQPAVYGGRLVKSYKKQPIVFRL